MSKMDELYELLDHIEMEHERELGHPYTFSRLNAIHKDMHDRRGDWGHEH